MNAINSIFLLLASQGYECEAANEDRNDYFTIVIIWTVVNLTRKQPICIL